jgi:formylglycine-generating enzyme required for sulfatase activity
MDEVRIFISYAREDEARVNELYQRLVDAGFQPWLDREHIIPGMKWEPIIKKALKQSDFVLVCLSTTSINKRGFLRREIKQALEQAEEKLEHDVYLIPARLDDCEVPDTLSEIQWVDLFEDNGWRRLLKAIEYGLKQRSKTMPTPSSSSARSEITAPSPSDSAPVHETKAPPRQGKESQTLIGSGADLEWHLIKESLQKKKAQMPEPVTYTPPQEEKTVPRELIESFIDDLNGVPLEMIFVPGSSFKTDSPRGRYDYDKRLPWREYDERPQNDVTAPGFYIGKYQITQAQWKAVMGNNPSHFKGDPALPVENISWNDAHLYCEKLAEMTGKAYRLPSEAEWEYACRAGTTGDYATDLDATAWYSGNSGGETHPVGQKQPNAFGLYDMHGNVWEWCQDQSVSSSRRVVRGGSWYSSGYVYRSTVSDNELPAARGNHIGFRVVVAARTS